METDKDHFVRRINEFGVLKAEIREPRFQGGVIEIITGNGTVFLINPPWVDYNALTKEGLEELRKEKRKEIQDRLKQGGLMIEDYWQSEEMNFKNDEIAKILDELSYKYPLGAFADALSAILVKLYKTTDDPGMEARLEFIIKELPKQIEPKTALKKE